MWVNRTPEDSRPPGHVHTFSVSRLVIWSRRFWVKTMVKTAWDLDEVSFMFVAATVLKDQRASGHPEPGQGLVLTFNLQAHRALLPASIRSWMSPKPVTANLDRSST